MAEEREPKRNPSILDFSKVNLIAAAVFPKEERLACRFYEGAGCTHAMGALEEELGCPLRITDLSGHLPDEVTPYRIGILTVADKTADKQDEFSGFQRTR